jgi:two-component system chemotaxis sensor kinase CheA
MLGAYNAVATDILCILLILGIVYLVSIKEAEKAKILSVVASTFIALSYSLIFGPSSNMDLYFYAIMTTPFLFFSLEDGKVLHFLIVYEVLGFAITKFCYAYGLYGHMDTNTVLFQILSISFLVSSTISFIGVTWVLFYNNEITEGSLKTINKEISDLLDNLRQGILTIDKKGQILPGSSAHTKEVLSLITVEGMKIGDILKKSNLGQDKIAQIESVIFSAIDQSDLEFEVNRHILPHEIVFGKNYVLRFYWTPILNKSSIVEKIMISVIDVSAEIALTRESHEKSLRLSLLSSLASNGKESSQQYIESSQNYFKTIVENLNENQLTRENYIIIFRALHTIKGNSRIYDFTDIIDLCHESEEKLKDFFSSPTNFEKNKQFRELLQKLKTKIDEISQIFSTIYSNDDSIHKEADNLLKQVIHDLSVAKEEGEIVAISQTISQQYERIYAKTLEQVIKNQVTAGKKLAQELGLAAPDVDFQTHSIGIRRKYHNKFQDIFSHILRNAIDHGINTNKSTKGNIAISLKLQNTKLVCTIKDSGKGLDIPKIALKAKSLGIDVNNLAPEKIAEFIFLPNLSTKSSVTTVSGRGVGMDFVKDATLTLGGQVSIDLSPSPDQDGMYRFLLQLTFPTSIALDR